MNILQKSENFFIQSMLNSKPLIFTSIIRFLGKTLVYRSIYRRWLASVTKNTMAISQMDVQNLILGNAPCKQL